MIISSVLIAQILGFYLVIISLCTFFSSNSSKSLKLSNSFKENQDYKIAAKAIMKGILHSEGRRNILFGITIVILNNAWSGWPIIINIYGLYTLLFGVLFIRIPNFFIEDNDNNEKLDKKFNYFFTALGFFIGVLFLYFAYTS